MKYKFNKKGNYVIVQTEGVQTSIDNCIEYINSIIDYCKQYKIDMVILDERKLKVKMQLIDDYSLANYLSSIFLYKFIRRLAAVSNDESKAKASFFETLCSNRGVNYRFFINIDDAIKWLQK